jgi:hypothetical protein
MRLKLLQVPLQDGKDLIAILDAEGAARQKIGLNIRKE